ncbi:type I restriction-modification system endonuclease [Pedobacter sp. SL55]|uniref:type I restriction-modification system endonuclease n=1 Tax=Pedobacter sp. SL55 TaxID=2995161 RepID=UPI00226D53EB|nr:type I restriction-modification system endonuclease [Pedobacter sp. SL55]WAC39862.1 type I restriction-modification system endonuclease [Pedobacter sp. SL55]
MQYSNFDFLSEEYPLLHNLAQAAEYNLYQDPSTSLYKLRQFGEYMTAQIFDTYGIDLPEKDTFQARIYTLKNQGFLPLSIEDYFNIIRRKGNVAVHQYSATTEGAALTLSAAFKLAKWFYAAYSVKNINIQGLTFEQPTNLDSRHALHTLETELASIKTQYEALLSQTKEVSAAQQAAFTERAKRSASNLEMSEAETRSIIDQQLVMAGWECDTIGLNYKTHKTLPQKGKNRAIAEWPCGGKWADYALFIGEELYAIVEAKKYAQDISSNLDQSKIYAECIVGSEDYQLLGQWENYKVPFLFASNGRSYIEQYKTKSGVWFLDIRNAYNKAHALNSFYSPAGLKELLQRDINAANQKLKEDDYGYLSSSSGLSLRYYQIDAIKAVEQKLQHENPDDKRALLVMATGTGKTRTIGGLIYRIIKANRFRRVLFLTDRTLLATQARDAISDNKVESLQTFASIYKIADLDLKRPDYETRLQFATVQSMVKRVFYSEEPLPVDAFDCIVVDEAHRGYILDRDFVEDDLAFRDQEDYIGQYKKLLFYFDAWKIGLTATPALHTSEIFGKPVHAYSYREAVIDGFLKDHEPPYTIKTLLNEEGIHWQRGESVSVYDPETNTIEELANLEDDIDLDVDQFNKNVLTPSFNQTVLAELVKELDPDGEQKTLIFAARDSHADEIVRILYEEFEKIGVPVHQDAIKKITGSIKDPARETKNFKNEKYPNIVVTVDLLTTGIDVPAICNLVFLRAVKSRILYEQMIGRATRLCDEIGKESFKIYDAVRLYEKMKDKTQMIAVANPSVSFQQLSRDLQQMDNQAQFERFKEQLIAKLQGKKNQIKGDDEERFGFLAAQQSPDEFINSIKNLSMNEVKSLLLDTADLWPFLDEQKASGKKIYLSQHKDEFLVMERGYGKGAKPEDYILNFKEYIEANRNKIAALNIICTKPADLDRKSLKELRLLLDSQGFTETALNTAWQAKNMVDTSADIIAYIRTLALGTDLVTPQQRVKNAINKIKTSRTWNKTQLTWIQKFEKQLLAETIITKQDLDLQPFVNDGGFKRLNTIFEDDLENLLKQLNEHLFTA